VVLFDIGLPKQNERLATVAGRPARYNGVNSIRSISSVGFISIHIRGSGDGTLSLSHSAKVQSVRPSADRLFESLAASFGERAIAVVLTGAGNDGSGGVPIIKRMGGVVIAQDAATAEVPGMPRSAIATGAVDCIVPLHGVASRLGMLVAPASGEA
jgi:two-component system, chemotaxis family, protein-glutamate methylesterase/glutaminase